MLVKKKSATKNSTRRRVTKPSEEKERRSLMFVRERSNGTRYEQPLQRNSETNEQREKRLTKREALTLQAFQIAYDNRHQRKAS
jgi:hypothetical protein